MSEILAIIALIIFIIIAKRNLVWGLGLIILLLPSYLWRLSFFSLPSTFLELMILAIFILWLLKDKKFKKINWRFSKKSFNQLSKSWRYLLLLWLLASLIALAVNPSLSAIGIWRAYFLEPMLLFLVFIYSVKNKSDQRLIIYALGGLVTWLSFVAIWQNFTGWNLPAPYDFPNPKRLTAVFSYPNALGLLIAPITAFFAGLWLKAKDKKAKIWQLGVFILGFGLLWLAQSQGALAGVIISLVILALLVAHKNIKTLVLALIVVLLFFGYGYLTSIQQQLFNPRSVPPVTSLEIRSHQWQETSNLIEDHWLAGSGLAGYRTAMVNYHIIPWLEIYLYPHNIFLNFWTELGLLGLVVFIILFSYLIDGLRKLIKTKHEFAWPITLAWLTWLIHGLVDVPYFKNDLSVLFFILLALTLLALKKRQEKLL